jgi:hypothetical protein
MTPAWFLALGYGALAVSLVVTVLAIRATRRAESRLHDAHREIRVLVADADLHGHIAAA